MDAFLVEYAKRKNEIDEYLGLLKALEKDNSKIVDLDEIEYQVEPIALKVCKATSYLILYNLVEATVTAGIQSIYDKISDENLGFTQIMENLRKVWWHSKNKSLTTCSSNELIENVYNFYCEAHSESPLEFNGFISGVSGNLSADIVRKVCYRYGIETVNDGRDLESIKEKRNWLAHGKKSFSDIGRDATSADLENICSRVYIFLDQFVENVKEYLTTLQYRVSA